ncbi:hypothetical protein Bbelb_277490 [Branchiostoma belcheri]|nr:hypothetical protein Bbelb_277490 [Branchiostoma belcheri]
MRIEHPLVLAILVCLVHHTQAGCCLKKMTFPEPKSTGNYVQLNVNTSAELDALTVCLQLHVTSTTSGYLFTYNVVDNDEIALSYPIFQFWINGEYIRETNLDIEDDRCHTVCYTWQSQNGWWAFYVDGQQVDTGSGLATGHVIRSGGAWILGQEQDSLGGSFEVEQASGDLLILCIFQDRDSDMVEREAYTGDLSCFNVWDRVLSPMEADLTRLECGQGGNVFDWSSQDWTIHGDVSLTDNQCDAFRVPDMSASSQYGAYSSPDKGVLDFQETNVAQGAWCPIISDINQWLMVDLHKTYFVTAVITQGRNAIIHATDDFVTSYSITYGVHSGDINTYRGDNGQAIIFPGNIDKDTPVRHELSSYSGSITARYVKFHTLTWERHDCMRAGVVVHSAVEPVGRWPLNKQDGARDVTGNGNDGIASGTQLVEGPAGPESEAFLFSGTPDSYIDIPNDNGGLDVRYSYTILAHIYPTGTSGPLFEYTYQNGGRGVYLWQWYYEIHTASVHRDGSHLIAPATSPALDTGRWHFVGGSVDFGAREQAVWVDGAKARSKNYTAFVELATQYAVKVGYIDGAAYGTFTGRISCLQLFNIPLNEHQIATMREACEEPCPYGWYPSGGHICYRAFDELVSWQTANARCKPEGGRLANVKDSGTHNFLVALKNSVDPDGQFWIGLSDLERCGGKDKYGRDRERGRDREEEGDRDGEGERGKKRGEGERGGREGEWDRRGGKVREGEGRGGKEEEGTEMGMESEGGGEDRVGMGTDGDGQRCGGRARRGGDGEGQRGGRGQRLGGRESGRAR